MEQTVESNSRSVRMFFESFGLRPEQLDNQPTPSVTPAAWFRRRIQDPETGTTNRPKGRDKGDRL